MVELVATETVAVEGEKLPASCIDKRGIYRTECFSFETIDRSIEMTNDDR